MTALTTIMRRAGGISEQEQLERLYCNMGPEYKMYIRFDDVHPGRSTQPRCGIREGRTRVERMESQALPPSPPTIIGRNVVGAVSSEDTHVWIASDRRNDFALAAEKTGS